MAEPTYCTVLAENYLPKALALADSVRRHQSGAELVIFLIDAEHADDHQLPDLPGVRIVGTDFLGLPLEKIRAMTTYYELVEFATAVKPLLFKRLLEDNDQVFYLDPDTYVTSAMSELPGELAASEGGVLLTSHFLHPLPPEAPATEGHQLAVGIYNLGFCGFDRRGIPALDWWWARLEWDCLVDFMSGLFVDQKWMDVGADLFRARSLRHHGYNVGVLNLHERPLAHDDQGYAIRGTDERLRLFHFHAFDPHQPLALSTRFEGATGDHIEDQRDAVEALCLEYAEAVLKHQAQLPEAPAYRYNVDTRGRRIPRLLRRAWRVQAQAGQVPPSPFDPAQAAAYDKWRRRAWSTVGRELAGDVAKGARMSLVDEFVAVQQRFPRLVSAVRGRVAGKTGIWG